jgi:glycosyltransferase involved in cell wall biosynthesis
LDLKETIKFKVLFPHPPGAGGPGSFQTRFEAELKAQGHTVFYNGDIIKPDVIIVVGGTRKLLWLTWMRLKGIPIIYRLDGIAWLHKKRKTSLKNYLTAEFRNALSKMIHGFLASKIIYQSQFVKDWWDKSGWRKRKNIFIIHNGVNIPVRNDIQNAQSIRKHDRLVILEGVIDYTPYAVKLLNELAEKLPGNIQIELYGKFEQKNVLEKLNKRLLYKGFLKREDVYNVFKGSVYLSLDINPACPNTVAEALACGAPVAAFKTGALPELVDDNCGRIIDYGSNPWELGYPDSEKLIQGILEIFSDYITFSNNAYQRAVRDYEIRDMFYKYNSIIKEFL